MNSPSRFLVRRTGFAPLARAATVFPAEPWRLFVNVRLNLFAGMVANTAAALSNPQWTSDI
jgi:hypothetical protein